MKYIKVIMVVCALVTLWPVSAGVQPAMIDIQGVVLGPDEKPVAGAVVATGDAEAYAVTDIAGRFTLRAETGRPLTVSALGFETATVTTDADLRRIVLREEQVQLAYRKTGKRDATGAVQQVDVDELIHKNYFTYSLDEMQGYVGGFPGNIWGFGGGDNGYLVLVDGVPRDANNVLPTEIEDITFMKGVGAVALYGSRAAKGVVYITTKRGVVGDQTIHVRANTGFYTPKSYPEYLGSAEYMTLYNEARTNDGLTALYDAQTIYNTAAGVNPYRYPSVDYYDSEYLKKVFNRSDVTAEITGGNERAVFYTNIGYYRTGSLFDFGQAKKNNTNRFNVRGNIDININDWIKSRVDATASFYNTRSAHGDYWSNAAVLRPNRFTPLLPISYIEANDENSLMLVENSNHIIDGKYLLGGTQLDQTNPIADSYAAGYNKYTSRQFQFTAGIDMDLKGVTEGLSFHTQFAVDYSTSYNQAYNNTYAVYEPTWVNYSGADLIGTLTKYGEDAKTGEQNVSGSSTRQTIAFEAQFNYDRTIDYSHNLSAMLIGAAYQQSLTGVYHKTSNANLGVYAGYNFRHKYYADFSGAVVHSAKLAPGKRTAFSPTVTVGWRLSEEEFLKGSSVVDHLRLTASAGILHTDLDITEYYLYEPVYTQTDGAWWGWRDGAVTQSTDSRRGANPDLTFAKRKEVNVGVETSLLDNLVNFDATFFISRMTGLVVETNTLYPNYFLTYWPNSSFRPYINYNSDQRLGFDFNLKLNKRMGTVDGTLGVSGMYYTTKAKKRDELYEYAYQNRTGRPIDGLWGLVSEGFFRDAADVASSPEHSFGEVQTGDIKYKDMNGDGVIDDKDIVYLGRAGWNGAPFTLGVNLTLRWNNFTFFALGTGNFGAYGIRNSTYDWVYGDRKYSIEVRNRWTEETKNTATYPRLTTLNGDNNFQNSTFWLYKTDRFNLAKVQVTYDIPSHVFRGSFVSGLSVYASGSNLLVISGERKLLERNVGAEPQYRFYNLGVKLDF